MQKPELRPRRFDCTPIVPIPAAAIPAPVPLRPIACVKCGAATEPKPGGLCSYCTIKAGSRITAIGPRTRFA